eukprot:CAMPEP_0202390620 /NCGR_PEP_ID=MMETSP1127-20130417/89682_1 /ASSEMBLY_ACC=CAM_ASM_000462 /TAXON_ID=3047 /ORGANISM="Dunaliella tertiolecta, Strain CCMP1320" /LENGTH=38 /DNA_ID= /DNA_START= /DNA_END= /DNA_ORIENTATION=
MCKQMGRKQQALGPRPPSPPQNPLLLPMPQAPPSPAPW